MNIYSLHYELHLMTHSSILWWRICTRSARWCAALVFHGRHRYYYRGGNPWTCV